MLTGGLASLLLFAGCPRSKSQRPIDGQPVVVVGDPDDTAAIDEREPNDSLKTAQELHLGHPLTAEIGGAKAQRDVFRLVLTDAGVLRASTSGASDVDLVLGVRAADGRRLVSVDNSRVGGGEILTNLSVDRGTYYLEVRSKPDVAKAARYKLEATLHAADPAAEVELNDQPASATPLQLGGQVVGYLGWRGDTDWYRLTLKERLPGALLQLDIDGVDDVPIDLGVRIDPTKRWIDRRAAAGQSISLRNIALPPQASDVFIVVRGGAANVEAQYGLVADVVVPATPTEHEPNDTTTTAQPLPASAMIWGAIDGRRDRDLFRPAATVAAELRPPAGVDLALAVIDAAGKIHWLVDAEGAGGAERIPAFVPGQDAAYLAVLSKRAVGVVGSYQLQLKPLTGRFETEPNVKQASSLADGLTQGFIHPRGDVDLYRISARRAWISISQGGRSAPIEIELLDKAGRSLRKAVSTAQKVVTIAVEEGMLLRLSGAADSSQGYQIQQLPTASATAPAPSAPRP